MASDRSRRTDGLRDGYVGVVAQQGRVTLDRDFNAEHGYLAGRIAVEACDVIGACGTPDDGFRITLPTTSPPNPPLWSPPEPLSPPILHAFDFLIGPGTMYVGGQRAAFDPRPSGQPVTYSYYDQPDGTPQASAEAMIGLSAVNLHPGQELVYLALAEQEVSAVEDPELLEVALGGPDTTQRLRLMQRVARIGVRASDCSGAWETAVALWRARDGLILDPATMRLLPEVRLRVGFANDGTTPNPCDPIAQGGYLGAENQTIRVQISDPGSIGSPGGDASLLWGYDNASFLYRATPLASNPAMLTIAPSPPDAFHVPQTGQVVEILRTATVLASEPDMTDPTGQRDIVRCVANATGVVRRLTQPYGPAGQGGSTNYIVLDQPLPPEYLSDVTPLFLRVWQSEIAFDAAGDTVLLTDDVTGASTGVEVTISVPAGEVLTPGTFWLLAVRPETPQAVYPERLLTAPQPPDGPHLWACPLAVINWRGDNGPTVTDCRNPFDNLVDLTKRGAGCCTVIVTPAQVGSLQAAIDRAAGAGGGATICLRAGLYALPAPLQLTSAHNGLRIEACGGGAVVLAAAAAGDPAFSEGLIVIDGAADVTLHGLSLQLGAERFAQLESRLSTYVNEALFLAGVQVMVGVHAAAAANLTLEQCTIEFTKAGLQAAFDTFGAGVLLQGDCSGLSIKACQFTSQFLPSFNRASATAGNPTIGRAAADVTTSPPVDLSTVEGRMLDLARTALQGIAANTTVVDSEVASNKLTATVGCLAVPHLSATGQGGLIPCRLGDAILRENRFENLTMALYGTSDLGTLRLQDNAVGGCIGGFWLALTDWVVPSDAKSAEIFEARWRATSAFSELAMLNGVGLNYPLPKMFSAVDQGKIALLPTSIFALGNQVEALPRQRIGTAALVILGNRAPQEGVDVSVSLIIANNRLRNRSSPGSTTALLLVQSQERCAVTGNLILNESGIGKDNVASLWLTPDTVGDGVTLLSVTGNVLMGRTNLGEFGRSGIVPAQTWALYNATPS
jgi:hypothetical protein